MFGQPIVIVYMPSFRRVADIVQHMSLGHSSSTGTIHALAKGWYGRDLREKKISDY